MGGSLQEQVKTAPIRERAGESPSLSRSPSSPPSPAPAAPSTSPSPKLRRSQVSACQKLRACYHAVATPPRIWFHLPYPDPLPLPFPPTLPLPPRLLLPAQGRGTGRASFFWGGGAPLSLGVGVGKPHHSTTQPTTSGCGCLHLETRSGIEWKTVKALIHNNQNPIQIIQYYSSSSVRTRCHPTTN